MYKRGLFKAYAYLFQCCGFEIHAWNLSFFKLNGIKGSGLMKRPMLDESYLAPKLSRPDSASRSLPVKCIGLGSPPEQLSTSPNGRLMQVSEAEPETLVR